MAQNINLTMHAKGPGIASSMVLMALLNELVRKGVLSRDELSSIFDSAEATVRGWGSIVSAQEAATILKDMRGLWT